jgi:hypothetical protein
LINNEKNYDVLNYSDENILSDSFKKIENNISFDLIVSTWQRRFIFKIMPLWMDTLYYERHFKNRFKKLLILARIAAFAFFAPTFWGILNSASIKNMQVNFYMKNDSLVVELRSSKPN